MADNSLAAPDPSDAETPLHSWKEIAAYLNRDVSTVKRWERHEGLPVHRHLHRLRSSVYAHRQELDAWRANRRPAEEPVPPGWFSRRPARVLAVAALLIVTFVSAGDSRLVRATRGTAQQSASRVERQLLSQRDMDLNNFFELRPSPDGHRHRGGSAVHP